MTITAEHSSGRYDVDPATLKAALTKQLADEPDFLSLTEMMSEARAAVLDDFPAYDVARVKGTEGEDECAALIRRSTLPRFTFGAVRLSSLPIPRRGGKFCEALVIRLATHTRIIVHMPSGVEGAHGLLDNAQSAVYRDAIGGLRRLVAGISGPLVITGDWNLDLVKEWVRQYLEEHFPKFDTTWDGTNLPELGTHGDRVIDFSLVRGFTVTSAHVVSSQGASDHRAIRETHKEIPMAAPDPYAHSTFRGKPLDNASIASLKLAEAELGYADGLTILQGIGGAPASAGTHLEGRAVDLAPFDRERKLKVLKDLGWAAWYRPAVEGLWGAHIHAILIFEARSNSRGLADSGFRQIAAFDAKRDGLKSNLPDPTYRPSTPAVFTMVEYAATFAPPATAPVEPVRQTPRWDAMWESLNDAAHAADSLVTDSADGTPRDAAARKIRAMARAARSLAAEFSTKH